MGKLDRQKFICVDCETTGLDTKNDRIIEVAAIIFDLNTIYEQFETLVNPECAIPDESKEIHNISQKMVTDKPTIKKVLPDLLKFIGNHIIVGHGVAFDIQVISNSAHREGIEATIGNNRVVDTLRLARLYGESPSNSLEQLRKHFNIEGEIAHRAMSDVKVNIEVFKYLVKNFTTTEKLFEVLSKPILLKEMPLGKHKGRPLKEIPIEYLRWAVTKDFDMDLSYSIKMELKRRKKGGLFSQAGNPFSDL